jgi:hypothetical protein
VTRNIYKVKNIDPLHGQPVLPLSRRFSASIPQPPADVLDLRISKRLLVARSNGVHMRSLVKAVAVRAVGGKQGNRGWYAWHYWL